MLAAELGIEIIFEFGQGSVWLARYGDCACLIFGGMHLNMVFEGVVVDIIWS